MLESWGGFQGKRGDWADWFWVLQSRKKSEETRWREIRERKVIKRTPEFFLSLQKGNEFKGRAGHGLVGLVGFLRPN